MRTPHQLVLTLENQALCASENLLAYTRVRFSVFVTMTYFFSIKEHLIKLNLCHDLLIGSTNPYPIKNGKRPYPNKNPDINPEF